MALVKRSEPSFMTAEAAARRPSYGARSELKLRELLEAFCRERFPGARIVHELVMDEGSVRADVVAIGTGHLAAFEIKGAHDATTRLIHQIGVFQLCAPEVWMVVSENHCHDAKLVRHLLPSVGLIWACGMERGWGRPDVGEPEVTLEVLAEPVPRDPVPEMLLQIMWRDELAAACQALRIGTTARMTRAVLVKKLLELASDGERMAATCAALRRRDAIWRADPPDRDGPVGAGLGQGKTEP